jgi:SAM-dependent methyltransferase
MNISNQKQYSTWKNWDEIAFGTLKGHHRAYFNAEIKRTKMVLPKNSKVLEIGYGNGSFLRFAYEKKWDVFGIEENTPMVKKATDAGFESIFSGDLSRFEDDSFDLVVAFDVIEHLSNDVLECMSGDIKRILRKGGCFIARFPNGDSPFGLPNQNGDPTHINSIGSGKVHYLANKFDLKVIFIGGEAQPLWGHPLLFVYRLITLPIKSILMLFTRLIFFSPTSKVDFFSHNLTSILQKKDT